MSRVPSRVPRPIRIPFPTVQREVGLGQAVKRVTTALGIRPCSGCQQRARSLDRRVVFSSLRGRK